MMTRGRSVGRTTGTFRRTRMGSLTIAIMIGAGGGCEAPPSTVELWIEPPAVYRFGSADAIPLTLPEDDEGRVDVLAAEIQLAVAESGNTDRIAVFAPYTGSRLNEPEYLLLRRAACEAGVRDVDLSLVDPRDPEAPLRTYDPAAAAPYQPPECGLAPIVRRSGPLPPRREFLPEPPD